MATYYARASGNVNAAIWATTPTGTAANLFSSFTNADVLMANNFQITLNVSTTVAEIRNDAANGATAGGTYSLNDGVTLTANILNGNGAGVCVSYGGVTSATIVGAITYGSSYACVTAGSGTLNIVGTINVSPSTSSAAIFVAGNATLNYTGNLISSGAGNGIAGNTGTPTAINITGNVTGSSTSSTGVPIAMTNNTAAINIVGVVTAGANSAAVVYQSATTTTITRIKGNGFGPGATGVTSQVAVVAPQNSPVRVYELEYGDLGQTPVSGPVQFIDSSTNVAIFYRPPSLTKKTLIDAASTTGVFPAAANVRSGTSYNAGNLTGTCAMPSPASVTFGVPVGSATGTAVLTPEAVWAYLTTGMTTSGSIGERMANAATTASVGNVLAGAL